MLQDDSRESKQNIIILYLSMASIECSGPLHVRCRHPWSVWNDRIRSHDWLWFAGKDTSYEPWWYFYRLTLTLLTNEPLLTSQIFQSFCKRPVSVETTRPASVWNEHYLPRKATWLSSYINNTFFLSGYREIASFKILNHHFFKPQKGCKNAVLGDWLTVWLK